MAIDDELRQEAANRASSPEGMKALVHALLTDFEQAMLPSSIFPSSCCLDFDRLASFFGEINKSNIAVVMIQFNPDDYIDLSQKLPDHMWDGKLLWGACVKTAYYLHRNEVAIIDGHGQTHIRQFYACPEQRMYWLITQYVRYKRQYEYYRRGKQTGQFSKETDIYYQRLVRTYKERLEEIYKQISPDRVAVLKKKYGADLNFTPGAAGELSVGW